MDKITELKEKLANEFPDSNGVSFRQGFDAAMELQLPVLFLEFTNNSDWHSYGENNNKWINWNLKGSGDEKIATTFTTKGLFDYWILNIYQPEK